FLLLAVKHRNTLLIALLEPTPYRGGGVCVCGHRALQTSVVRLSEAIAAAPPLDGTPKHYSPKVQQLVNDIASLTLIEVSDLNELLKVGLVWITSDSPASSPAIAGRPSMPSLGLPFLCVLQVQGCVPILVHPLLAKKLVESLPQEIKANVSKEEAEKLKAALEAAGGTVLLE
uniref:Large ribosomal subunit protein bL12 C-terminal domain-containing protein n=1 Tax=Paramormyrops kingsleyae TaxID=1676925 RepID=A0A3B3SNI7_9TELE